MAENETAPSLRSDTGRESAARFRRIVAEHGAALSRWVARLGVSNADVDDLAQEVLLVASAKIDEIAPGSERGFLLATAVRLAQNWRRGLARRARRYAGYAVMSDDLGPSPEDLTAQLRARELLDAALDEMPGDLRGVFEMFEFEDLAVGEIASRLALPTGTTASRLRRARESLDERLVRMSAEASFAVAQRSRAGNSSGKSGAGSDAEIMSWWVSGGEAEALAAVLEMYRDRFPGAAVVNAAVPGTTSARGRLRTRMAVGAPPDTFQTNGGRDLLSWIRPPGASRLDSIDFLVDTERWRDVFPKDLLDLVTHDGQVYAVPVNVHRTNALFVHRGIFARHGLEPPRSFDDFYRVCAILKGHGVTPLAFGHRQPWTLALLAFENILVGEAGPKYYREFFTGLRDPNDPEISRTLAHLGKFLDVMNPDAGQRDWSDAAELMATGGAAMTIMGDWAKGYLTSIGLIAQHDFTEHSSPGSSDSFVFATDTFGLPRGRAHREGAVSLLKLFGSRDGQSTFNRAKGSLPARMDVDLSSHETLSATARDFHTKTRVPSLGSLTPTKFTNALEGSLAAYAESRNPEIVVATLAAQYRWLKA